MYRCLSLMVRVCVLYEHYLEAEGMGGHSDDFVPV